MKIIKSAITFKAELPRAEVLAQHLKEIPYTPVGETFISAGGFIPNPITGELLTPLEGGFSLTVQYDEKILPKAAVRAAIQRAQDEIEANDGPLNEDEAGALIERITADLISKALVKTTVVHAFYHTEKQFLIVPASKSLAQVVVGLLIKACGSVKTSTIHVDNIKGGLTTRLRSHLDGAEDAFEGFKLGESCLLKHRSEKVSFDLANLDHAKQGLDEALRSEMQVERMELVHGNMSFKLAKDFRISGIDYFGELTADEEQEREDFDMPMLWRTEAAVQMIQLVAAIDQLCHVFGYKEPAAEVGGEEATGNGSRDDGDLTDPLYADAVAFVRESNRACIAAVQRKFMIGYNRAARMVDAMEGAGVVTPRNSNGEREVIKG